MKYKIAVDGKQFEVEVGEVADGLAEVTVDGKNLEVKIENFAEVAPGAGAPRRPAPAQAPAAPAPAAAPVSVEGGAAVTAPIPGLILDIKVNVGDAVTVGQTVATMEAMKMENNVASTTAGTVKEIRVKKGSEVATGDVIMVIG